MRTITIEISELQAMWLEETNARINFNDQNVIIRRALDFTAKNQAEFFQFLKGQN